jgi:signal transduction histidine kinase
MRTGLRTEIILSISLLLAAALLFAGFLLVKLSERNLLDQQRVHAADVIKLIVAGAEEPAASARRANSLNLAVANLERLQTVLGKQADIISWRLLDTRLQVLSSTAYAETGEFATVVPSALDRDEIIEELSYQSFDFFGSSNNDSYLDLSAALWAGTEPYGLLQIRFSLAALQERVWNAQRMTLVYVIVYGIVLVAFGVYLLNRNVVKPVRLLHEATTTVASGTLSPVNVKSGPGEIHELAGSFNQMVDALAASRSETEAHITTLEETNQALQRARDDLVRSEKLATIGHLAAGMAHEIGNPLGAVVGYLNILKQDLPAELRDLVERSLVETGRIDKLIRELLEYSAPVDRQSESFCPVTLLRETVAMLRHQGQFEGVLVDDDCSADGCTVSMDRGRLMQVWINLLLNARDAMQGEGHLELLAQRRNDHIHISIKDEGRGIEAEALSQVFEPFFTTKDPGQGYGLGLAVCQRIIDESNGSISVDSKAGQGTNFTVTLPCDAEASA